jgi:hypothetical protein
MVESSSKASSQASDDNTKKDVSDSVILDTGAPKIKI